MTPLRVKICGVTRLEDALAAASFGADALGFNFWPGSKRYIPPARAAAIISKLPPFIAPVGLFVNATAAQIRSTVKKTGIAWVQLHGDEPPAFCRQIAFPRLKAVQVEDAASLQSLDRYDVSAFVLDTPSAGYGGSGRTFDWRLARAAAKRFPVLLAGGLTPDNVGEAVRSVRPLGVDVASGVETAPGIKDARKLRRFIEAAREASRSSRR